MAAPPQHDQRPGVVYRVHPATGKSSVFFDLNTVIGAILPGATAANNSGAGTGLVNWYDLAFDPEGYFDGRPSLFISSADATDPNKNAVYRVGPDGTFLGAFAQFPVGADPTTFAFNPTSIHVPPPEQQSSARAVGRWHQFRRPFFSATGYRPGQTFSPSALPAGVSNASLGSSDTVGQAALGLNYGGGTSRRSPISEASTPSRARAFPVPAGSLPASSPRRLTTFAPIPPDLDPFADSRFRRFQDVAFDQYGYFSNGLPIAATGLPAPPAVFAGGIFVADLGTGVNFTVTPVADRPIPPSR